MKFFKARTGNLYAIDRIRKMVPPGPLVKSNGTRRPAVVELEDGLSLSVDSWDYNAILEQAARVIPAFPGFEQLTFWYTAGVPEEPYISASPIIGWRDSLDDGVVPITIDDTDFVNAPQAIRSPAGDVLDLPDVHQLRDGHIGRRARFGWPRRCGEMGG